NDAPAADAGPTQTVDEGDDVRLDATGSTDPEGGVLTYTWTQTSGSSVSLSDGSATQPTFTAPEGLVNSTLTFEVSVSDGTNTSIDTVTITVNADNDAPAADAGPTQTVDEGDGVTLDATGSSDPEGGALTYAWTQTSGSSVSLSDGSASQPTFTAPEGLVNSTLTFQVSVSDGTNTSVDTVTITVNADNDAPIADAGPTQAVDEGEGVTLDAAGSKDPEGDALTYTWTQTGGASVSLSNASGSQPTFTAPEGLVNSTLTFQVSVSDGTNTSIDTVTITVNADNDAPAANPGPDQIGTVGGTVSFDATRSIDPEDQLLTYTWRQISGEPVEINGPYTAQPSFTVLDSMSNTKLIFELLVSDGVNTSVATVDVSVIQASVVGLSNTPGAPDRVSEDEPAEDTSSDKVGDDFELTVEGLPMLMAQRDGNLPQDLDPQSATMPRDLPGATQSAYATGGARLEPDGRVTELRGSRSNLGINMQVDNDGQQRAKLSDDQQQAGDEWRRWQTHDDQFEGRESENDAKGESGPGLFARMWISLVVGLRSLLGGGSDGKSGR
ncbi:MAG: VCBS repeat-containing protein, partial [Planctomycetota bacterium]